jgi:hypothetical protein
LLYTGYVLCPVVSLRTFVFRHLGNTSLLTTMLTRSRYDLSPLKWVLSPSLSPLSTRNMLRVGRTLRWLSNSTFSVRREGSASSSLGRAKIEQPSPRRGGGQSGALICCSCKPISDVTRRRRGRVSAASPWLLASCRRVPHHQGGASLSSRPSALSPRPPRRAHRSGL